jgi:hypothetical protein
MDLDEQQLLGARDLQSDGRQCPAHPPRRNRAVLRAVGRNSEKRIAPIRGSALQLWKKFWRERHEGTSSYVAEITPVGSVVLNFPTCEEV